MVDFPGKGIGDVFCFALSYTEFTALPQLILINTQFNKQVQIPVKTIYCTCTLAPGMNNTPRIYKKRNRVYFRFSQAGVFTSLGGKPWLVSSPTTIRTSCENLKCPRVIRIYTKNL
jgi:hypothetical protein